MLNLPHFCRTPEYKNLDIFCVEWVRSSALGTSQRCVTYCLPVIQYSLTFTFSLASPSFCLRKVNIEGYQWGNIRESGRHRKSRKPGTPEGVRSQGGDWAGGEWMKEHGL